MIETLVLVGTFTAGAVAGRFVPWGQLKSLALRGFRKKSKTDDDEFDEDELAAAVLKGVQEHIVAETIRLRDMAKSDDPAIEDAMRGLAKGFLIGNRRFF